ncbi:hypothetical protein [Acetonema longum]|uniref:YD repeat-containing protein n=1 Tax=Acetonema longum DSM 6540 TaxID=1009370 RepID=F7NJF5_9FIRM|nr:hypothetical protein [Acetonema longum]EGO63824.1 YD repeat-containing protein [Acetonema longum DSM 6540]
MNGLRGGSLDSGLNREGFVFTDKGLNNKLINLAAQYGISDETINGYKNEFASIPALYSGESETYLKDGSKLSTIPAPENSAAQIEKPRRTDYFGVNGNVGKELFGVGGGMIMDRYGNLYTSVSVNTGKSGTVISGSVIQGGLNQPTVPTSKEMKDFLPGQSVNVSTGVGFGSGKTTSIPLGKTATEWGLYTPQVGASVNQTFDLNARIFGVEWMFGKQ